MIAFYAQKRINTFHKNLINAILVIQKDRFIILLLKLVLNVVQKIHTLVFLSINVLNALRITKDMLNLLDVNLVQKVICTLMKQLINVHIVLIVQQRANLKTINA